MIMQMLWGKNTQLNINSESVTDANPEVFGPGKGVQSFIFLFFDFHAMF